MKHKRVTKASLTVEMLLKGYSVDEIMAEMLKVFPGSGTTENSIYYYASKTPGVSLSQRNDNVDNAALAALKAKLNPGAAKVEETKEVTTEEADAPKAETHEQMVARIRAEVEADIKAETKARQAATRAARLVKKQDRVV